MIAFTSVSANMGQQPALRDVSVEAGAGEVVALTGPNGAGKSTLLKVAAGLITPAAGDVLVGGALLTDMPYAERARHIAWLPQVRPVAWNLFAEDLVALGLGVRSANGYDRLAPAGRQRVDAALAQMSAGHLKGRRVQSLSGGEAARLHMARVLVSDAKLLLLDEPAAALDIEHQLALMDVLAGEAGAGRTVLVAIHDLDLAARFCSRIVVMHEGRVEADGPPEQALSAEVLDRVFRVRRTAGGMLERIP